MENSIFTTSIQTALYTSTNTYSPKGERGIFFPFSNGETIGERAAGDFLYVKENHLGNVLSVVSDRKLGVDNNSDNIVDFYLADVTSATDYYAFGSSMPGRSFNSPDYRYGFNGQEKIDEISGSGNHNTALFWEYDTRTGRRWNLDPKPTMPMSDYACFANNPIWFNDPLGDVPTEYTDEKGKTISKTDDGNNSKVVVPADQRKEFDKTMTEMSKAGTTNHATANQSLINKITPADKALHFTSQSYGLQYLDLAQQQNKVEMTGFLESKGGLVVAPREGFVDGVFMQNTLEYSEPMLLKMSNGVTVINSVTYKLTAHIHTHPNLGNYADDFSGQMGMSKRGDLQSFEGSFFKSNNISTFYLLGPNKIQGAYVGKSGRIENLWEQGDKKPYLNGTKKLKAY